MGHLQLQRSAIAIFKFSSATSTLKELQNVFNASFESSSVLNVLKVLP